jgi:hypothetical protein
MEVAGKSIEVKADSSATNKEMKGKGPFLKERVYHNLDEEQR